MTATEAGQDGLAIHGDEDGEQGDQPGRRRGARAARRQHERAQHERAQHERDGSRRQRPRRPPQRLSVIGVLGDVLITAGVLVLLFIGWQQWFNDIVVAREHASAAQRINDSFAKGDASATKPTTGWGDPKVSAQPGNTEVFGTMYVPRFGADYAVPLAGGTTTAGTLDTIGVGHYDDTQMPGEVGNFAVAGHRTTHGAPFNQIANLQIGDKIYVSTADGWYTYTFRNLQYVPPTQVSVLDPAPDQTDVTSKDRVMTMTSCNPLYSAKERIVAFSVYDSWQPRSAGPPAAIANEVNK